MESHGETLFLFLPTAHYCQDWPVQIPSFLCQMTKTYVAFKGLAWVGLILGSLIKVGSNGYKFRVRLNMEFDILATRYSPP